jgi:hypothetical protein
MFFSCISWVLSPVKPSVILTKHSSSLILPTTLSWDVAGNTEEDGGKVLGCVVLRAQATQDEESFAVRKILTSFVEKDVQDGKWERLSARLVTVETKPFIINTLRVASG